MASYTDMKYFGLILSPVADCNLAEFYIQASEGLENLNLLRQFFGCLATGLQYLHSSKIRHRDIKPENILIKSGCVYLADFGISLDWDALTRSTTTEDTGKSWIYCAPEVANYEKRNSTSDIWSLGCVFLEMCSILKGRTVHDMRQYFKKLHDTYKFYQCLRAIQAWSEELWKLGPESDKRPLHWAALMMHRDPDSRPSANDLCGEITRRIGKTDSESNLFCGECCYIGSDADSSQGSTSGCDLWAENLDDEITSPATSPLTSPLTTDSSRRKAESGTEDTIVDKNSNHLSSTNYPTAIQKAMFEPETRTVARPTMPTGAHARATEAFVTETYSKAPDELPITAYQEAIEMISPQESVRTAVVPHFRKPMIGQNLQPPVESSSNEAYSLTGRTNVSNTGSSKISKAHDETTGDTLVDSIVVELGRGSITSVPDETGKDSNTKETSKTDQTLIETAMDIEVQPPVAVLSKPSVAASTSGSPMTTPFPLFSRDRRTQTLSKGMPNGDAVWGQTSSTVGDNDQMQSSSSGDMLTREVPEKSQTIPSLPERQPPISPKMTTEHRKSIEISNTEENNALVVAEKVSATPDALPWMTASEVTSMPTLTPNARAASISSLSSTDATLASSEHRHLVDTSGMNGIGEWTNEETQTNSSREGGKEGGGEGDAKGSDENTKIRRFPSIKAQSWHSPEQFIVDVIKDSNLIQYYEAEDLSRLISERDPQSITTLVVRMIGDDLPINTDVYTDDGLTPLAHVLNWGDGYQALFELMVDAEALIDKKSLSLSPLMLAVAGGHLWAVKYLFDAGVGPNGWSAVSLAAQYGRLGVVKYLIEEANYSLSQETENSETVLHRACKFAQLSVVKYLMENCRKSVNIEARCIDDTSTSDIPSIREARQPPIMHAYFNKQPFPDRLEVIKVLLEHGANPNGGQEVMTGNWSLLHYAASRGQIELVELLLKYPVKISTRTFPVFAGSLLGETPITLAKEFGHMEIVRLLQAAKKARKER